MATTIIDQLLVTLGLDGSAFKKGSEQAIKNQKDLENTVNKSTKRMTEEEKKLAEERKKQAKELEQRSKQTALALNKIRNEALGLLAIFTAGLGIKEFVSDTINSEASLYRMSQNLNMTAKDLAEWKLANEKAGGSAAGMVAQLNEASSDIARFKVGLGMSDSLKAFFRFGGSYEDLRSGNSYLKARADIVQKIFDVDPTRAMAVAKAMGISEDTFNLIKLGSVAIDQMRESQSRLAEAQANNAMKAEKFRQNMVSLKNSFMAITTDILTKFMPALKSAMQYAQESIPAFSSSMKAAAPFILGTLRLIANGWENISGWIGVAGKKISDFFESQNDYSLGKFVAKIMALGGSKEAQEALAADKQNDFKMAEISGGWGGKPRGLRNNNPGNIEYGSFAIKHGAIGSDGRFAVFPNLATGQAALTALLSGSGYLGGGKDTIAKILNKYAPGSENNTSAYIAAVTKQTGFGANQRLSSSDIPRVAAAIGVHEEGKGAYQAAMAAASIPYGARMAGKTSVASSTSSTDVKVNTINVHTQATDAAGIAKSIGGAVTQYGFVPQANTGMS